MLCSRKNIAWDKKELNESTKKHYTTSFSTTPLTPGISHLSQTPSFSLPLLGYLKHKFKISVTPLVSQPQSRFCERRVAVFILWLSWLNEKSQYLKQNSPPFTNPWPQHLSPNHNNFLPAITLVFLVSLVLRTTTHWSLSPTSKMDIKEFIKSYLKIMCLSKSNWQGQNYEFVCGFLEEEMNIIHILPREKYFNFIIYRGIILYGK